MYAAVIHVLTVDVSRTLQGDLYDYESLVKAIEQVDVVISTVGHAQLADQATHAIELTWVMCFEVRLLKDVFK
ncbi:hypothetical protein C1H46_042025 [Malus baccata]|uniref:Uncharacterized protein n=1 Tax=Malus baccata TaxID=106549 RepID=A0A540KE93_MALBA|nr:hypothetical protein C1H46_042025 [Malus baccata]